MRSTLFRPEALQQEHHPMEGSLLIAASPNAMVLAVVAFALSLCTVLFICFGEFNRKATVQGYLSPDKGLIKVFAMANGILLERRVAEGDRVRKGEVLAVISTQRGNRQVRDVSREALRLATERQASLENERLLLERMDKQRRSALEQQQSSFSDELEQLDSARQTLSIRLQKAIAHASQLGELKESGFVAGAEFYRQQDVVMELQVRLQVLERDRIALIGKQQMLKTERVTYVLDMQSQMESLKRRIMELALEKTEYQANSEMVVTAPSDGVVTTVLLQPGQQTRRDAPLLSIIPEGAVLEAKLLVPSHAIGFIAPGQTVAMRYAAFPYQRFGHYHGVVSSIARTLLLPGDADTPAPLTSPAYLVTVDINKQSVVAYEKQFPLQAGMALDGDVLLDRRSIVQWMFDPLLSLTERS
ncbi:MAG: HlyD family secretion protein [Granulosicoccus sp.]